MSNLTDIADAVLLKVPDHLPGCVTHDAIQEGLLDSRSQEDLPFCQLVSVSLDITQLDYVQGQRTYNVGLSILGKADGRDVFAGQIEALADDLRGDTLGGLVDYCGDSDYELVAQPEGGRVAAAVLVPCVRTEA